MIESIRTALIAAGLDPDVVAAEAAQIDLSAPTRHEQAHRPPVKHERMSAPITTMAEQMGLDVGEATGVVAIRPGTKKHEALASVHGKRLEPNEIPFLREFIAADLVTGDDTQGWTASARGATALGMLDYGATVTAEKGKNIVPQREAADQIGKYQREGQSSTSRAAAQEIAPITGKARLAVLACIHVKGGATDEEVEVALGMNPSTVRPRRVELVEAEAVKDSGHRRRTASGREAVVWEATEHGAQVAAEHLAGLAARSAS